jgi:hypothetical protein
MEVTAIPRQQLPAAVLGIAAALMHGAFVVLGAVRIFTHKWVALTWFRRPTLLNLLVVQPFQFYQNQLGALSDLVANFAAYLVLSLPLQQNHGPGPSVAPPI